MKINMGPMDRKIRAFVVAPILIILGIIFVGKSAVVGVVLFVLAAVMLGTSAVKSCPLYLPFGIDTGSGKAAKS